MARKANQELNRILVDDINKLDATLNSARRKDGKLELIGQDNKALWDLILFMTTVLSEKTPAFKIILRAHEKIAIPASSLANYFGIIGSFRELYSSDLSYAPHLQLFFDCYREYPFCSCMWKNKNRLIPDGRTEPKYSTTLSSPCAEREIRSTSEGRLRTGSAIRRRTLSAWIVM